MLELKFEFDIATDTKHSKAISMSGILINRAEYKMELLNVIKKAEKRELAKSEKDELMNVVKEAEKQTDSKPLPPPEELDVMGKPKLVKKAEMMNVEEKAEMQELDKSEKDKKQEEDNPSLPS